MIKFIKFVKAHKYKRIEKIYGKTYKNFIVILI